MRHLGANHNMVIQGPSAYKGNWFIGERLGDDPTNKVLGIVGFGRIGQSLAQKCRAAFNMEVCGRGGGRATRTSLRLYYTRPHFKPTLRCLRRRQRADHLPRQVSRSGVSTVCLPSSLRSADDMWPVDLRHACMGVGWNSRRWSARARCPMPHAPTHRYPILASTHTPSYHATGIASV